MWARVQNNIAVEIINFNPSGRYHPDVEAQFIEVPDHVVQGASLVDGQWVNPTPQPPLTPDQLAVIQATQEAAAKQQAANQLQQEVVKQTQSRLDDFARTRNYDGILSLCTYATSTNDKFKTEGQYGVEARDATWAKLYEMMAEVSAGTRPMPSGYADVEPELPVLVWPDEAPTA